MGHYSLVLIIPFLLILPAAKCTTAILFQIIPLPVLFSSLGASTGAMNYKPFNNPFWEMQKRETAANLLEETKQLTLSCNFKLKSKTVEVLIEVNRESQESQTAKQWIIDDSLIKFSI